MRVFVGGTIYGRRDFHCALERGDDWRKGERPELHHRTLRRPGRRGAGAAGGWGPQLAALLNGPGRKAPKGGVEALNRLMGKAHAQAENYATALPECPPFLMMVDVGAAIHLWADFERAGRGYAPFPDVKSSRIDLTDLRDPAIRERLRKVWDDPRSLDPQRPVNVATHEISGLLGRLVRSMRDRALRDPSQAFQPIT